LNLRPMRLGRQARDIVRTGARKIEKEDESRNSPLGGEEGVGGVDDGLALGRLPDEALTWGRK
jgi:hypothetical protein